MSDFAQLRAHLPAIQDALRAAGLDGWLLYDLHARNGVATHLLGLGDLSRRYFVVVPATGEPRALTHGIEQMPWADWPYAKDRYSGWQELHERLPELLAGVRRIALETSPLDAVPAVDLVPAGVLELIRAQGVQTVSSGDLVSQFYARWSPAQRAAHQRASAILAQTAHACFERLARAVRDGAAPTEGDLRTWVLGEIAARGLAVGADTITANGVNAANPHYELHGAGATFQRGDLVLLDLWAKEDDDAVFADQTWMAYLGDAVPERAAQVFAAACDARDAAVRLLVDAAAAGRAVQGYEVDDAARGVIRARGYGDYFIHRTGHSIDRATHGMGPNIDNYETHETRRLLTGVGFSIEPGIYIPGELGVRTEINVYMDDTGPDVTTPGPQTAMLALL